jgi:uncharacterized protein YceK
MRPRTALVCVVLVVLLAVSGCAARTSTGAGAPTSSTTATTAAVSSGSTSSAAPVSALAGLAGYLEAVAAADVRIRRVAALVNGDITAAGVRIRPTTAAAIQALDVTDVAAALPPGMPASLTRAALLVFSELSSRRTAFHGVPLEGLVAAGEPGFARMTACLANGARAAARFGADVAALRTLAAATEPLRRVEPASRAAAEIALRTRYVQGQNGCCDSCGGYVSDRLVPIVWNARDLPGGVHVDGTIDGIDFEARYRTPGGWQVAIHAG